MDIIVDATKQTVLYGDLEGDEAPGWLRKAIIWWLSKHVKGSFEWGTLSCPLQHDGFSCGILAQNGLAHSFIPIRYPLIDASSPQDVMIAWLCDVVGTSVKQKTESVRVSGLIVSGAWTV
jgi:hypothetical protein